jgi:hypothetical protein
MSNDIVLSEQPHEPQGHANMFARSGVNFGDSNSGAVAVESERAIAEAQGKMILSKRFPRSVAACTTEFLDVCKSPEFAEAAFYTVPNRGSGPSIRFAEEAARCCGNFHTGHKELTRGVGKSLVEVYAWDMEKNNYSTRQITIEHIRDTKNGPVALKDQVDIDNRIANVAQRQLRGRILAILPKVMVEAGKAMAKRTLAGSNDKPVSQRITDMTVYFGRFGVTPAMLEKYLDHKIDETTIDELADLQGVCNAIREGTKASEFFGGADTGEIKQIATDKIKDAAKAGDKAKASEPAKTDPAPAKAAAEKAAEPAKSEEPKEEPKEAAKAPVEAKATEADEAAPAAAGDDGGVF